MKKTLPPFTATLDSKLLSADTEVSCRHEPVFSSIPLHVHIYQKSIKAFQAVKTWEQRTTLIIGNSPREDFKITATILTPESNKKFDLNFF